MKLDCDVEWKFARAKLWLNYMDNDTALPVPFNLVPTLNSIRGSLKWIQKWFSTDRGLFTFDRPRSYTFIKVSHLGFYQLHHRTHQFSIFSKEIHKNSQFCVSRAFKFVKPSIVVIFRWQTWRRPIFLCVAFYRLFLKPLSKLSYLYKLSSHAQNPSKFICLNP